MSVLQQKASRGLVVIAFGLLVLSAVLVVWAQGRNERHQAEKRDQMAVLTAAHKIVTALDIAVIEGRELEITEKWFADVLGDSLMGETYRVLVATDWQDIIRDSCDDSRTVAAVELLHDDGRRTFGAMSCMRRVTTRAITDDTSRFTVFLFE